MNVGQDSFTADAWKRDGSSLVKGEGKQTTRYDVKLRQNNSPITDASMLDIVLRTLNDPKTVITGTIEKAYVGAFELEKAPEQDVKADKVYTKVMQNEVSSQAVNTVAKSPPKALPEPFMRAERIGSWIFIFANNKLGTPLTVDKNRLDQSPQELKGHAIDSLAEKINSLLIKNPTDRTLAEKTIVDGIKKLVSKNNPTDIRIKNESYTFKPATLDAKETKTYEDVLTKREALILAQKPASPPPVPKRIAPAKQQSPLDAVRGTAVPKPPPRISPREQQPPTQNSPREKEAE